MVKCMCLTNIVQVIFCALKYHYIWCEIMVFQEFNKIILMAMNFFWLGDSLEVSLGNREHKRGSLKAFEFLRHCSTLQTSFSTVLDSTCHHKFLHLLHCFLHKFDWTAWHSQLTFLSIVPSLCTALATRGAGKPMLTNFCANSFSISFSTGQGSGREDWHDINCLL